MFGLECITLAPQVSVTPSMVDVYGKHHSPYWRLVERTTGMNQLIDQTVYRLYGLMEEEITVVTENDPQPV